MGDRRPLRFIDLNQADPVEATGRRDGRTETNGAAMSREAPDADTGGATTHGFGGKTVAPGLSESSAGA